MRRIFLAVLLAVAIVGIAATPALANWYAGYYQGSGCYGVKADIYTPASAPYIGATGGESNWVSIPTPYWVQTGWRLNQNTGPYTAQSYWEYNAGVYDYDDYEAHNWGTYKNYAVACDGTYWKAYRNGSWLIGVTGGGLPTPPTTLQAMSEVHVSSTTVLDTDFRNVQWRDSGGTWNNFSQWWNRQNDSPYNSSFTLYPSNFDTWGP